MQYRNLNNQKDANTDITIARKKSLSGHSLYILETTFFSSKICLKYENTTECLGQFQTGATEVVKNVSG